MGLLQAMLIAMGIFFGTENNTQGSVNKNHANINGQSNASEYSGFVVEEPEIPVEGPIVGQPE